MKLTRRELVVAVGSAAVAKALAQAPPGPRDFAQEARDNVQRNGAALAKFAIPMTVEPAFQFKA
ncbi:MAG TPA: hypothetical protein VHC90_22630 [Bryobacteraceae bacterium]|nr:hypothetical protein [Bryobacteraceae bacterium]